MKTHDMHQGDDQRPTPPERRLRVAEVRAVRHLTPHMKRITIGSDALEAFPVSRPAQWVKLFVPTPDSERPNGRAYTIRAFHERKAEMDIDFVLHGDGPCSLWAEQADVGDVIQIAGPRGSFRLDPDLRHLLIGGDETALPAIGAIIEALPAGLTVEAFIEIPDPTDAQILRSRADVRITWLPRHGMPAGVGTALQDAVTATRLPETASAVWFAAEAGAARSVRRHFQLDCGLEPRRIQASGYWKKGETDFRDRGGDS
ncbi:siderophore-interacting protein [Labrys sp. KNU-23]|uniref:siderophore-interacting protein n=1 Tax=Labrys sp. KNU-23 TaxID=2789216 RepID=UPI00165A9251|nr:siderophore-interacting protein [Labrys sp. KNU-23]